MPYFIIYDKFSTNYSLENNHLAVYYEVHSKKLETFFKPENQNLRIIKSILKLKTQKKNKNVKKI